MRFRMTGKTDGNIWVEVLSGGYESAILANRGVSYQVPLAFTRAHGRASISARPGL